MSAAAIVSELVENKVVVAAAVGVATAATLAIKYVTRKAPTTVRKPGVVYLHMYNSWKYSPHSSPFCLRLDMFLRAAKIPFEVIANLKTSPKGKMPWIELDGETYADSALIILVLKKRFNVDLNAGLSEEQRGVAHAFEVMTSENLYWGMHEWSAHIVI
jgi:hypothetical protein